MSDVDITTQKYQYSPLASIDSTNPIFKRVNFYGIVIEASFPYSLDKKHLCILKVVDPTVSPYKTSTHVSLSIFSKDINVLPRIHYCGAIIRIHRGFPTMFKEKLQINCELPKASWALFKGYNDACDADQYSACAYSGKSFTMEESDKKQIDELREFSKKMFSELPVVQDKCIQLKDFKNQKNDGDSIVQVLSLKEKKNGSHILKVYDSTSVMSIALMEGQAKSIELCSGDVVKIRGFKYTENSLLYCDKFSNIMILPESKARSALVSSILTLTPEIKIEAMAHSFTEKPIYLSKVVDPKISSLKISTLESLLKEETTLRVKASILDIQPPKVSEWVAVYNKKSKDIKPVSGPLKQDEEYCYRVQLMIKDESDSVYRIVLFTGEGIGKEFLPAVGNPRENKQLKAKLGLWKKLLLNLNSSCDLGLRSYDCNGSKMWLIGGTELSI